MAIFYCDIYNGDDSNNGLTTSTPKKTINATSSLVTAQTDEIRVRAYDNLSTNLGNMYWINGSLTLTGSTNLTGSLSGGSYIYKSTNTLPDIYKISSLSWNSGTSVMTITLSLTNGYYEGTTEYCGVMKVNTTYTSPQSFSKDGYNAGETSNQLLYSRTGTTVSGGWDSGYTSIVGYTLICDTGTTNVNFTSRKYWDISYFMSIGGSTSFSALSTNKNHHLIAAGSNSYVVNALIYGEVKYCVFNSNSSSSNLFNAYLFYLKNCIVRGGGYPIDLQGNYYNQYIFDSTFTNSTNGFNNLWNTVWVGNTIKLNNVMFNGGVYMYFSGNTLKLNNSGNIWNNCSGVHAVNNTILGNYKSVSGGNGSKFINSNITNIVITPYCKNIVITDSTMDSFNIPTTVLFYDSWSTIYLIPTDWQKYYSNDLSIHLYSTVSVILRKPENNMILYNTACLQTTGITYSGNTSLKITQYNSGYPAYAGTVDFYVNTGNTYTLSFWIKSSNSQNFTYNYFLNETAVLSSWISGTTSSSNWTEITTTINSSSIPNNGFLKPYFNFSSGTGHYIYISNIRLT